MPKNRIPFLCLIFIFLLPLGQSQAQNVLDSVHINWLSPVFALDSNGNKVQVLNFEGARYMPDLLPYYQLMISGIIEDFQIRDLQSGDFTQEEIGLIPKSYSGSYQVTKSVGYERGNPVSIINIVPIQASNGGFKKLKSFRYSYGRAQSPALRLAATSSFTYSSVLSSGSWYKFSVSESGIYKIDYDWLKNAGINPDNIDPRKLKIYGNGGGMLPQNNSAFRYDDLVQNTITVIGEKDGKFNTGDYILFYGQSPHTVSFDSTDNLFHHTENIYSDKTFYFLTTDGNDGLRVSPVSQPTSYDQTITTFDDFQFVEQDLTNLLHSGRLWLGEKFDYTNTSSSHSFNIPGILASSDIKVSVSAASGSSVSTSLEVTLNGISAGVLHFPAISGFLTTSYPNAAELVFNTFSVSASSFGSSQNYDVGLRYNPGTAPSVSSGYLNYIEMNVQRNLQLYGSQTTFRSISSLSASNCKYVIANGSNAVVWDISDPLHPQSFAITAAGVDGEFFAPGNTLHEFVTFSGNSFSQPVFEKMVSNQNLHGISAPVPELLIITTSDFLGTAQRLENHRSTYSGITSKTLLVSDIYNEFSSGAQDITAIRDFIRMVYSRGGSQGDSLRYVLLLGDCSYDYKDRISNNTDFVPTYEAKESFAPTQTYSSDDYYGFMEPNEGDWPEPNDPTALLDIGIGRLPAANSQQANDMVNKIIYYDTHLGTRRKWRNDICFVSDDGENNSFESTAEMLASKVASLAPVFNINKIYLDAYPQIPAPGGQISPEATQALNDQVESGALLINYDGHGGETGWAQEKLLQISDIQGWDNMDKLTFLITATCDFGRYDDPNDVSGAEYAIRNQNGGAAGLMTTTRPVYSSSNTIINKAFYDYAFDKSNGKWMPLGSIMRLTKNHSISGVNNRNYSLLGDPSMTLGYPEEQIVITKINGTNPANTSDTLKALSKVSVEGEIQDLGKLMTGFNGTVYSTIYDKPSQITTLGDESAPIVFSLMNNYIYDGKASVVNGKFSFSFIVPKDISYQYDHGKISLYASESMSLTDANGYNTSIVIGGSNPNAPTDNTPPQIRAYMNDSSFVNGGVTGPNSTLLIKLFDESGINISGTGIGHDITAVLDDSKNVMVLNQYYSTVLNSYQRGLVQYPMKGLSPGPHTLKIRAWDTYDNSAETTLEFIVYNDQKLTLKNVLNYPNPFSTHTNFHFDHNRAGDDLQVMVQVFTVSGKLIKTIHETIFMSQSHVSQLSWDGRDDFDSLIGKGVYVYKLEVRSMRDGSKNHRYQKLVLLN